MNKARGMKKGDKMDRETYGAVRRRIGGTKGGFFGESIEVEGKYTEAGYVVAGEDTDDTKTGLVFAAAVITGLLGATAYVVLAA